MAFPIGLDVWAGAGGDDDNETGRRVGTFYACNVAGGIVGSLLAGFVLVPGLGLRRSVIALAVLLLLSGLALAAVITADLILPEHAGAGKLWSVEYWELVRAALDDDGMMLQWVPTHRSQAEYEMVLRSLLQVFPDATVWAGGSMLVGTKKPLSLDPDDFARKLRTSEGRAALAAVGLTSFEALTGHYTAGPEQIRAFVGKGPLLTDDHPPAVSTPAPDGPTAPGSAATCATCSATDRPTSAPAVVARGYGWMDARTTPPNPA